VVKVVVKSSVRKNDYRDSVFLMRVSSRLEELDGVRRAAAMMTTENNKRLFKDVNLLTEEIKNAGPNDLAISVDAIKDRIAENAISLADELLAEKIVKTGGAVYRTLSSAMESNPDANLILISTPGAYAMREARRALEAGKHVMIFSDGVPFEDEIELKRLAAKRGLLLMGPEAGTSIIGGVGLGFSNVVRSGPIGVVGAAGTGIQEVTCLISRKSGITHAIGVGGRDLSQRVDGAGTISALKFLAKDQKVKVIVVISKPPATSVSRKVLQAVKKIGKPDVVCFLGGNPSEISRAGMTSALTLEDAAEKAIAISRGEKPSEITFTLPMLEVKKIAENEYSQFGYGQKYVRGLFSGGSLCDEAIVVLEGLLGDVCSNVPLKPKLRLSSPNHSKRHTCVDMGTEDFTRERPHPMIDLKLRCERLLQEAKESDVAVVLLDVVLGYGAHPDPAGELAQTIEKAKKTTNKNGGYLSVVASVCGTPDDPQGLTGQEEKLRNIGTIIMPSNAQASRMAAIIASKGRVWRRLDR
jgi:FdrA protein